MSARSATQVTNTKNISRSISGVGGNVPYAGFASLMSILETHYKNRVLGGPCAKAPTTASTQATGAAGATVLRVDLPAFRVIVNGAEKEFALEADRVLHDTTVYTGVDNSTLTSGKSAIVSIVAKNASGTISLVNVKGGTATTGSEVEPTDAQINTAVSSVPWVKCFNVTVNRTGDLTVTQSQNSAVSPELFVNVETDAAGVI